jgi:superfamily II DNA/RNA helicase
MDPSRKKFNVLIRAVNGSGKTLAFLLPMISSFEPGLKYAEDKMLRGGKVEKNEIFRPQGVIIIQNFLLQSQLGDYLKNFRRYGDNHNIEKLKF